MVSLAGYGYGVPVNYVYHNGAIYFHCAVEGSKIDNIRANNKVSFCVVGETEPVPERFTTRYESVIVFGTAAETEGSEKEEAFIAFTDKYCHDYMDEGMKYMARAISTTCIVKIEIQHISGKRRNIE
jgi:Predicted flavin-nucleotide-binding protein